VFFFFFFVNKRKLDLSVLIAVPATKQEIRLIR
jgi:hypothetical protein